MSVLVQWGWLGMRELAKGEIAPESILRLVQGIPFFNEIARTDSHQLDQLLTRSRLLQAEPGDVVIRRGDSDSHLYFLLKGQLNVLVGDVGSVVLNTISSGQPLGVLAMLRTMPRSATLVADPQGRPAVLLALDFSFFRDIEDYGLFTLATKLSFYKMIANDIRWTLEMNKKADPANELVASVRKVPLFAGTRGTREELIALRGQALALADILCQWNEASARR